MGKAINELRARVRASLASMDETPAPPVKFDAQKYSDQLWDKIERNPDTGRRERVAGRIEAYSHEAGARTNPNPPTNGIDALAGVLRSLATFTKEGRGTVVTYHDGEREPLREAAAFLATTTGKNKNDIFAAVRLINIP